LAISAMAKLLAQGNEPATASALQRKLGTLSRTDHKVSQVLAFYAEQLAPEQRYLMSIVSLFSRPVHTRQILVVAGHPLFDAYRETWKSYTIQAAAGGPLAGLLHRHNDGALSAHPLVRDAFRPLALGAAMIAADVTLGEAPQTTLRNSEQAQRLVEAIELCIEADQWQAADDLYRGRTLNGQAWQTLPAARLGWRAASVFVLDEARQLECRLRLGRSALSYYLNESAMLAIFAGDARAARDRLQNQIANDRQSGDPDRLIRGLCDLAGCLCRLGRPGAAAASAAEAVELAHQAADQILIADAHAVAGWAADWSGDSATAELHFLEADHAEYPDATSGHASSQIGIWWAAFLARTDRLEAARILTKNNLRESVARDRRDDVARCHILLAQLDGDESGDVHAFRTALAYFRDGDYLYELADALVVAGELALAEGRVSDAAKQADEAVSIAAPRGLVPIHTAALTLLTKTAAAGRGPRPTSGTIARARDTANAALHLACGANPLPWHELSALDAHSALDRVEGADNGWSRRAAELRNVLIPANMDRDPLNRLPRVGDLSRRWKQGRELV
jgi:hypothetical protein